MFKYFALAFIPLFVAVDAIGVLPMFVSLTEGIARKEKKALLLQSFVTASILAVSFIFLGKYILGFLGISMADFMIAGGAILFCIAIIDILNPNKDRRNPSKDLGAVPIGTPLIVGPAVLTTCMMMVPHYGMLITSAAVVANIVIGCMILYFSDKLIKILGEAGTRALSKIMALLLAAIAVMMIRKGIFIHING